MMGHEDFASVFGELEKNQGMKSKKEPGTGARQSGVFCLAAGKVKDLI